MKNEKESFQLYDALEIMNRAPLRPPSLVTDLLLQVGVSMLVAKPKCGKSTLARQLSVSVAEGRTFLNYEVMQGDVLYMNLEGAADTFGAHLRSLEYTGQNSKIHLVNQRMPDSGDVALQMLRKTLSKTGVRLVILDPAIKFLRLPDSDKNDFVSNSIEKLEGVAREFKTHVMLVAHAKKRSTEDVGDSALGSTGFRGGTDTNLFLSKREDGQRVISTEQRYGKALEPTIIVFDEERGEMSLGQPVEEADQLRQDSRKIGTRKKIENDIFKVVCNMKSATREEILSQVTGKTTTVIGVLNDLCESGKLVREGDGTKGNPTRYIAPVPVAEPAEVPEWIRQIAPQVF